MTIQGSPVAHQCYSCDGCGTCCRHFVVELDAADQRLLDRQDWSDQLPHRPTVIRDGRVYLNKTADGACEFLDDENQCRIHARYGVDAKPLTCQLYPFEIVPCSDGQFRMSLRFDCHAVTESVGDPIQTSWPGIRLLAKARYLLGMHCSPEAVFWAEGTPAQHAQIDLLVSRCDAILTAADLAWSARLALLAGTIESFIRSEFTVGALDSAASVETEYGSVASSDVQLLRGLVYAVGDYVSFAGQVQASMWGRVSSALRHAGKARAFQRGTGLVPALHGSPTAVQFADIDVIRQARDGCAAEVAEMMTRWMRTWLLSRAWLGRACHGWSVQTGLAAWLMMAPMAGWVARWFAAGERRAHIERDDLVQAIRMVDHGLHMLPPLRQVTVERRLMHLWRSDGAIPKLCARYGVVDL